MTPPDPLDLAAAEARVRLCLQAGPDAAYPPPSPHGSGSGNRFGAARSSAIAARLAPARSHP